MTVALIPARGGSKSIPMKNIKSFCGRPLIYWTVKAACCCSYVDKVYVSTDSREIQEAVGSFPFGNLEVISRSPETATDTAPTESAMIEFAQNVVFDHIALIQATSPSLTAADLEKGFAAIFHGGADSVLSAVRQKRFCWEKDADGFAIPLNYEPINRPRRQDFEGHLVENGAFYITSRESLLHSGCRLSGNIKAVEMGADSFYEIDEPADWIILEALMKKKASCDIPAIRMFLTDCDGCLTDGGMYYTERGDEIKKFNTRDGMGFQLLRERGILTGIVTGEDAGLVHRRAKKLKTDILKMGVKDKLQIVRSLCEEYEIGLENVAYIGDDINDLAVIDAVGFGCSVNDGLPEVKAAARYVTEANGGAGAIREVAEKIIAEGGFWPDED